VGIRLSAHELTEAAQIPAASDPKHKTFCGDAMRVSPMEIGVSSAARTSLR